MDQDSALRIMETFRNAGRNTLPARMGIEILEASAERVVGTMPVAGNTQPYGLLHGGASCVLAETLGSLGAALHGGPDRVTLGIEINATHHRAASAGQVTGVATRLHGGRTAATYEIVISDQSGRRVCTSRLTCLITDRVPGRGAAGPDRDAPPDRAGPPDRAAPPDDAGPPDRAAPPDDAGPPDRAPPSDGAGPPRGRPD